MRGHIRKRGNKYSIVVDLGRDHNGKRKQKWFSGYDSKRKAEKDLPRVLMEAENNVYVETTDITFGEYMIMWLQNKKDNIAYGTYHHYESYSRNHIIPGLGKWKTKKLSEKHIESFMNSLKEKDLSKRTQRHIYRVLRNAVNSGSKYGIPQNIFNDIEAPKVPKNRIEYWSEDEVKKIIKVLKDEKHFLPIFIAITTGMRQGEVLGLRWEDVDLENKVISVQQQLKKKATRDANGRYELSNILKTPTSYRTISIDDRTVEELKKHKAKKNQEKGIVGEAYKQYNLVHSTSTGNFILPSNLNSVYWRAIEKAEVKRISFHSLRHTHATILLKQGAHPKVVQERLGHSSIEITLDTYSHVIPGLQKAAAEKFGESIYE
ncbi:integrase [Metabacillus crassostreae]|uniref:tyrosine-type recombinase/integrase n=1 Tax=Metabacillus crassostreae TaxID=929098 RepID=UPI00195D471F|nr:tyrosine-type recombinase/integrase [Metabacillus crassostreae]MBM7606025.1 integrase [Metabacillus crassostreae]